ncbi:esterase/lipase family protein [Desulfosediminicola ganghwensis]|uniref:esterase/lipase family protein n=1 Tax=Desulfosediminicola ganghwensis TaxID=2569540 RepID=UPI0010AC9A8E|nr:phospholipase [Desulfosediminicola ganghwensis]
MRLLFIHGWSVTNTKTYGELPQALSSAAISFDLDLNIQHLYLGRYISFRDEVTVDDLARALDQALRDLPENNGKHSIAPFSCITHSTGGPVVRYWIDKYYSEKGLEFLPLKHLVMLAPANHGSALAKLGKTRVGRIKAWFQGVEPGQRILDWLSLGSDGQWSLNQKYLDYDYINSGFYPFVLTGQGIDEKFYDFVNSYLVENGSDGVVRVAGANMNYRYLSLAQSRDQIIRKRPITFALLPEGNVRIPEKMSIGVYNEYSHSGTRMGIMRSVESDDINSPIVTGILKCLKVESPKTYEERAKELDKLTEQQQAGEDKYCMLIFNIQDDHGEQIGKGNYDLFLLAGKQYKPELLPKGFFKDRQMNDATGRLIYYLNYEKMKEIKDGQFGLRIVARPSKGFSYYCAGEFRSNGIPVESILSPNQTTYVDVRLHRFVDKNVFRFDPAQDGSGSFKNIKPSGNTVK